MDNNLINIKFTLKQARLLKGLKQEEMAKRLGVHVQTYRRMEKQPDTVTVGDAKKISEILQMDYDYLFFNDDSTLSRESGFITTT